MRPGEKATLFRFWMARDTYQAVSAMQSPLFANAALVAVYERLRETDPLSSLLSFPSR